MRLVINQRKQKHQKITREMCGIWLLNNNFIMNISIWFCPHWFALIECSFFLKLFLSELVHFRVGFCLLAGFFFMTFGLIWNLMVSFHFIHVYFICFYTITMDRICHFYGFCCIFCKRTEWASEQVCKKAQRTKKLDGGKENSIDWFDHMISSL